MINSIVNIQHWKTKKSARVYLVQRKELPIVDIEIIFNAGSAYDENKYGVSQLTNSMLNQGTKHLTSDQISKKIVMLGIEFGITSDRDVAKIGLRVLKKEKYFKSAIALLGDILSPNFCEREFIRLQKLILSAIDRQNQVPEMLARNYFFSSIYNNHPYEHSVLGTTESIMGLNVDDLKKFFQIYYSPKNAVINIVGDIDRNEAGLIAEQLFYKASLFFENNHLELLPVKSTAANICHHISFPTNQTHILIGQVGLSYNSPDYLPLMIGNDILGGSSLTSRLYRTVREKYGLAYSVLSLVPSLKAGGQFMTILQTRNREMKNALKVTRNVINEFIVNGPTRMELIGAKKKIINGFPQIYADNASILQILSRIALYELPLDYLDEYCHHVTEVKSQQIQAVFSQYFPLDTMVTVTVGK